MLTMTEPKVTLGFEVRRYRERAGISQEKLSEQLGVSREAVSKIERGATKRPSNEILQGLEDVIGLTRKYAYELIGDYGQEDADFDAGEALLELAALPTHEERMSAWRQIPRVYQQAIQTLMADILRDTALQLEGLAAQESLHQD